jgi:hypothetical protein
MYISLKISNCVLHHKIIHIKDITSEYKSIEMIILSIGSFFHAKLSSLWKLKLCTNICVSRSDGSIRALG